MLLNSTCFFSSPFTVSFPVLPQSCPSHIPDLTLHFVADELSGVHLADAAEETVQLLLGHALRQVVDDEVGLGVFIVPHVVLVTVRHVKLLLLLL